MTSDQAAKAIPYVRRHSMFAGGAFVGFVGLWVVAMFVAAYWLGATASAGVRPSIAEAVSRYSFAPIILAGGVSVFMGIRWRMATQRRVEATGGAMCTTCAYDLRSAPVPAEPATVRCPECGDAKCLAETRALWQAWLYR